MDGPLAQPAKKLCCNKFHFISFRGRCKCRRRDDVGVRDVLQMFGRHICGGGDMFVVEVGGVVCVREGLNRNRVSVVVGWVENAVSLYFFELLGKDGGCVVSLCLRNVDVE